MNTFHTLRYLTINLIALFMLVSCGGGDGSSTTSTNTAQNTNSGAQQSNAQGTDEQDSDDHASPPNNLQYIKSASLVIKELWIYDTEGNKLELLKGTPKTVQLVPATDNFASLFVDLPDLTPGEYRRARLVLSSGEVLLADNAYIAQNEWQEHHGSDDNEHKVNFREDRQQAQQPVAADPYLFTTELGNLKFPSGHRRGIKVRIEPPIKVVTNLEPSLLVLHFDLNRSFVFNGSPSKRPGVKRILFKPFIKARNDSTHGMVSLNGLLGTSAGVKCMPSEVLPGATVTAIDPSGTNSIVTTTTDENGSAQLMLLPGTYTITIEKDGYESQTFSDVKIEVANSYILNQSSENIVLVKERTIASQMFDRDVAILMAIMSNVAYQTKDFVKNTEANDIHLNDGDSLTTVREYTSRYDSTATNEYQGSCWIFKKYIKHSGIANTTQLFVAIKPSTGDIVVSFEGTSGETYYELGNDYLTDVNMAKVSWTFRMGFESDWNKREGKTVINAVHSGMKNSYLSIADDLKNTLDEIITSEVSDTSLSRVYFTGHSLGSGLATLASLDFANYLTEKYHYNRNNIMMYGFATPRVITKRIQANYQSIVPNSYAVAAKDDVFTYMPGIYDGAGQSEYTHIAQLVMISTNLRDAYITKSEQNYDQIGNSRLEYSYLDTAGHRISTSKRHGGCLIAPFSDRNVGFLSMFPYPSNSYYRRGHDRVNYIKRLVHSDGGIPRIGLFKIKNKLEIRWTGGVQGPCDRVRLFEVPAGTMENYIDNGTVDKNYLCTAYIYPAPYSGSIWAVNGNGYATEDPNAVTSKHTTCENPDTIDQRNPITHEYYVDFWAEYVDGFGNVLAKKRYRP